MRTVARPSEPDPEDGAGVRPLEPGDIAPLVDLWVGSWRATFEDIDFEARRDWIGRTLREAAGRTLVAHVAPRLKVGPRLTGFAIFAAPYLHQLVVAEHEKGRGTARRLLEAVKTRAPDGIVLDVNQRNVRAVAFYRKEGFVRAGDGVNAFGRETWRMRWP